MRIKLSQHWIDMLLKESESGMGYQRVDVRFVNGRHLENAIVFNAEHLEVPDAFIGAEVKELKLHRSVMRIKPSDELAVHETRERRSLREPLEFREDGDAATISGYAAVFNKETIIGGGSWGFREVIEPGAFDEALSRPDDVRVLFNHNPDLLLGRTESDTARLSVDKKGLKYEADLPDTAAARDVRTLIKRGDVSGSSFAFTVVDDEWEEPKANKHDGTITMPLRRVKNVELFDVSAVTYPAYPQTSVSARSKAQASAEAVERQAAEAEAAKTPASRALEAALAQILAARAQAV